MERISLKLPKSLAREVRKLAAERYRSLNGMVTILLVEALRARAINVELPTPKILGDINREKDEE